MKHALLPCTIALAALALVGCQKAVAKPGPVENDDATVLVRVGDHALSVAALQAEVDKLPLERRVELTTGPEQQAFIQKAIDQEILAAEAERLGYDRSPEALAAAKRAMVTKLLKERIGNGPAPGEITEADMHRYYSEHQTEFGPPERIRIALIMMKDPEKARAVHAEAEAAIAKAAKKGKDEAFNSFQALVTKYTEEEGARDVTIAIHLNGSPYPKAVTEAGVALENDVGSISPVIETPSANFIVQLKETIPASILPYERVKDRVLHTLSDELRERKTAALVSVLEKQHGARVHKERFSNVRFEPDPLMQAAGEPSRRSATR